MHQLRGVIALQLTLDRHRLVRAADRRQARDRLELRIGRRLQPLESGVSLYRVKPNAVLDAGQKPDLSIPLARAHAQQPGKAPSAALSHHLFEIRAHLLWHEAASLALLLSPTVADESFAAPIVTIARRLVTEVARRSTLRGIRRPAVGGAPRCATGPPFGTPTPASGKIREARPPRLRSRGGSLGAGARRVEVGDVACGSARDGGHRDR